MQLTGAHAQLRHSGGRRDMVVFTLKLLAPPNKRSEIMQTLRSLIGPTLAERGCRACHLQQDAEDQNLLTFSEEWENQADLDLHMASAEYRKLLAVMDMASEPPKVTIMTVQKTSGMDRIAKVRKYRTWKNEYQ